MSVRRTMENADTRPEEAAEQKGSRPLERYIQVLEMVAAFPEEMTLAELSNALDLPKTTVYRLLNGLSSSKLVSSGGGKSGGFRLAPRLLQLIHAGGTGTEVAQLAEPHLQDLAEELNMTSYLAKLVGSKVRTVAMGIPKSSLCVYVMPGSEMHAHATASAKAIVAFQPEAMITRLLQEPLPRLTPNTRTDLAAVLAEYEEVRETGVARCLAEDVDGFGALACPIRLPAIGVMYSIGVTGPIGVVFRKPVQPTIDRLIQAAERLSAAIGVGDRIGRARIDRLHDMPAEWPGSDPRPTP